MRAPEGVNKPSLIAAFMSRSLPRSTRRPKPRQGRSRAVPPAPRAPQLRLRRRLWSAFRVAPRWVQISLAVVLLVALWFSVNGVYQVVRKPAELFFPVSGVLVKTPGETWRQYAPIFRTHATAVITPELLAALAQVEGSGDPLARTYWRWSWSTNPFEIYRPASSAVGMYQITDGTFAEAKRYCVHDHAVVEDGRWHEWNSCWFNFLYARVVPSHAVELTSAYLDRKVGQILARQGLTEATLAQQQELAAVIHLCGAGAGNAYARRGLRVLPGQHCGAHDLRAYLAKVNNMRRLFAGMAAEGAERE